MEGFVRFIVAGGLALVAGLWITQLGSQASTAWLTGIALAALGGVALAVGIYSPLEY
ncbi:MAG: hypothetical protein J07HN4v3_03182 [Halonotius sp. J07HN4]|jgi:hypothetical protein|nr:MAG: hypothetical protein J07HN4v3_03182 [Halonotius sp. J07HN4]